VLLNAFDGHRLSNLYCGYRKISACCGVPQV
jgi:hypothetical protein